MKLASVLIRFYKSFNFDYIRKNNPKVKDKKPWEKIGDKWYPYVQILIDPKVTTVVGANESGKSHLLSAIEKAISGEKVSLQDFCRYSQFFAVKQGEFRFPDFGSEWSNVSEEEQEQIRLISKVPQEISFNRFFLFRTNKNDLKIYFSSEKNEYKEYLLDPINIKISDILPHPFRIKSDIALPQSVPIKQIIKCSKPDVEGTQLDFLDRTQRLEFENFLEELSQELNSTPDNLDLSVLTGKLPDKLRTLLSRLSENSGISRKEKEKRDEEIKLAYKLICQVAGIATEILEELAKALIEGDEGYVQTLLAKINTQLTNSLNFPSWWVQDRNFRLCVTARDRDLVFTIRDRTGTEYSFSERSSGLKYFMSYYIQYRAHQPHKTTSEILLMDEPDTYLSSQAQQYLLKIFAAFSNGEEGKPPVQVVYVTHSPFLIDKNNSQRIRVLEKSKEGTRVIDRAVNNHYEPLRSALGASVGETTFIGNCNLIVEGDTDQILIAGASTYLSSLGDVSERENLDLNHITIVPAGGASHVPYLVFLARGRDNEKPPVIVLLDSDSAGTEAKNGLKKGGFLKRKKLLKEEFVLQIGDLATEETLEIPEKIKNFKPKDIEDLIPLSIAVEAAKLFAREDCKADTDFIEKITEEAILSYLQNDIGMFDSILQCFQELSKQEFKIQKFGFARNVVRILNEFSQCNQNQKNKYESLSNSIQHFVINFKLLFRRLDEMKRNAEREETNEEFSIKIERKLNQFLSDHSVSAKRENGISLLDTLDSMLDESHPKIDKIREALQNLKRDYKLDIDMVKPIDNYQQFKEALDRIKYIGEIASQELEGEELQEIEKADIEKAEIKETRETKQSKSEESDKIPV